MENLEGIQDPNAEENTPQVPEAQGTEQTPPEGGEGEPGDGAGGEPAPGEGEPAPYTPDFNFKYKDEDFTFDERLQSVVKTKEDEQFVRDLVTADKAIKEYKELGGIREIQDKFEKYGSLETEHRDLNQEIDQLSGMLALDNSAGFESFRQHIGISKEMIMKWAVEEAQAKQNPELAQQIATQRNIQQENFNLQYQNNLMQNSRETEEVQQRTAELDTLLGSNDVSQAYDNLVGTPGSFKQAVIEHGAKVYQSSNGKINLTVDQAVEQVAQKFQGLIANPVSGTNQQVAQNPAQTAQQVQSDPQQTVVVRQEGKSTLPNVGGGSGSPAKKKITSLDGLRQHAASLD